MSIEPMPPAAAPGGERAPRRKKLLTVFNAVFFLLLGCAGFFSYLYLAEGRKPQPEAVTGVIPSKSIQMDVLNGCGARGAGARMTSMLRGLGFDVVEMKNYSSFRVAETLVIDRVGDLAAARRVAGALGVRESNVVQQINPDYFVDVSVVIGEDYTSLKPAYPSGENGR
ncbi:MAG TPA: LytR C-terminal domain-containing protein [Bacteroidota bacterium]|nr:LytR C-terminal domain-containing protein [Bacteroidota bacterium]